MGKRKITVKIKKQDSNETWCKTMYVHKIESETMNKDGDLYVDYCGHSYEITDAKDYYKQKNKKTLWKALLNSLKLK